MVGKPGIRFVLVSTFAALLLLTVLAAVGANAGRATVTAPAAVSGAIKAKAPSCTQLENFDAADFPRLPEIDNRFLPMKPGMQLTLEGAVDGVPHRVVFTVTDLTKKIDGVRTLVIWDTDTSEDQLVESELAFFAQDEDGNVWNLGEYPEEFEDGKFVGAPSTWITGEAGAEAGIHMPARRGVTSRLHVQGFAPEIDFLDCARVADRGLTTCTPVRCFDDVLVTHETNLLDPEGGVQSKYHAPRVGIVRVGTVDPPTGEVLELVEIAHLDRDALSDVRREALRLDRRGYRFSEVYRSTSPAKRL
jgi:hypothetical protein